eukprot:2668966-Pleurochrysis_carterae.AAC.1
MALRRPALPADARTRLPLGARSLSRARSPSARAPLRFTARRLVKARIRLLARGTTQPRPTRPVPPPLLEYRRRYLSTAAATEYRRRYLSTASAT